MILAWARSRLAVRTSCLVLGAALGVGLLADQVALRVARERVIAQQHAAMESLLDVVEPSAAAACFVEDKALAKQVVQGLIGSPSVQMALIRSDSEELARAVRGVPSPLDTSLRRTLHSPFQSESGIGEVMLVQDPADAARQIARSLLLVRTVILSLSLAVGLILAEVVYRSITLPIGQLSERLHKLRVDSGAKLPIPKYHAGDEIGQLVRDVNSLVERQAEAIWMERSLSEQLEMDNQRTNLVVLLGAGMAHDFNNLLTLVSRQVELGNQEVALETVQRAAILGRRIMSLGRKERNPELFELGEFVEARVKLFRHLAKSGINLVVTPSDTECWVEADPLEIEQILVNLVINARDALRGQGTIGLETHLKGEFACLVVKDDGPGMDPSTLQQVFQPYFTTKEAGQGTGLGLASVRAIVEQLGGEVQVESAPGQGAAFSVLLPAAHFD